MKKFLVLKFFNVRKNNLSFGFFYFHILCIDEKTV